MRLTPFEIDAIQTEAKALFGTNVSVYLFGSRADDNKKGGDIDLILQLDLSREKENYFNKKIEFLVNLKESIGEQKIDVLIAKHNDKRNIIKYGLATGVRIC